MTFNPNARLDTSEVQDQRGRGMPGGRLAIGGGVIGIVVLVVYMLLGGSSLNPNDLNVLLGQQVGQGAGAQPANSPLADTCQTGADANARQDCAIIGYVDSVQAYWGPGVRRDRASVHPGPDGVLQRRHPDGLRRRVD
jgi:predicted metalloprotease